MGDWKHLLMGVAVLQILKLQIRPHMKLVLLHRVQFLFVIQAITYLPSTQSHSRAVS